MNFFTNVGKTIGPSPSVYKVVSSQGCKKNSRLKMSLFFAKLLSISLVSARRNLHLIRCSNVNKLFAKRMLLATRRSHWFGPKLKFLTGHGQQENSPDKDPRGSNPAVWLLFLSKILLFRIKYITLVSEGLLICIAPKSCLPSYYVQR